MGASYLGASRHDGSMREQAQEQHKVGGAGSGGVLDTKA